MNCRPDPSSTLHIALSGHKSDTRQALEIFGASLGALGAAKPHPGGMRRVFGGFLLLISLHMLVGHRT